MLTNAYALLDNHTTACTGLTRILGVNGNHLRTSFFNFVRKELPEHPKRRVVCGQGEIAASHERKVQIFDHNCAVGFSESSSCLVPEVFALVGDVFVKLANPSDRLAPTAAVPLLSGQLAIQDALFGKRVAQPSGVVDPVAVTQGGKAKHTHVKPNGFTRVQLWNRIRQFNLKVGVPVADVLLDDDLLDRGVGRQRSMQSDFDIADVLNVETITRKLATVTVAIFQRLESVAALEAGQSTNALVERLVGFIKTAKHLLDRSHVEQSHFIGASVPLFLDSGPLIAVADRLARTLPPPTTLIQGIVVNGLHLKEQIVKDIALLISRAKAILVGQDHLRGVFLLVNVSLNCFSGDGSCCSDKVTASPHVGQLAFQVRKLFAQHKCRVAFQSVHNLVRCNRRREATKEVNMIRLDRQVQYLAFKFGSLFLQQFGEAFRYRADQNTTAILGNPNEVIVDVVCGVPRSFYVHDYQCNTVV